MKQCPSCKNNSRYWTGYPTDYCVENSVPIEQMNGECTLFEKLPPKMDVEKRIEMKDKAGKLLTQLEGFKHD